MSSVAFLWGIPQGAAGPESGVETPNRMTSCAPTAPGAKAMSAAALRNAAHSMVRCDLIGTPPRHDVGQRAKRTRTIGTAIDSCQEGTLVRVRATRPPGIGIAANKLQLNHTHPEHRRAADVDVVLAHEGELAVVANAEDRQTGRDGPDRIAVSHIDRKIVLGHEHPSTRIDVKRAWMDCPGLDVLDGGRLPGGLVDRIYHDAVLAALEHHMALDIHQVLGTIRPIQKAAVRMHVDRACRLTRSAVLRLGQRFRAE